MTQLALTVEAPLVFRPVCHLCGRRGDDVPVEGDNWHEAECWTWLALKVHMREEHGRG